MCRKKAGSLHPKSVAHVDARHLSIAYVLPITIDIAAIGQSYFFVVKFVSIFLILIDSLPFYECVPNGLMLIPCIKTQYLRKLYCCSK